MENIIELRCVLNEGAMIKNIITSMLVLATVEAAIVLKCLMRWHNR